jgi:hypothetical protein
MAKAKENDVISPVKRRLSDLFVTGEEIEFDDGTGEPIKIWLQKLTPAETQMAVDKSRPSKTKIISIKKLPDDHHLKLRYLDELESAGLEEKIDFIKYLIQPKLEEARISAQERVASEDEWVKDDYLIGLQQAWNEDLQEKWVNQDEESDEADRVYDELKRYTDQVYKEVEAAEKELINELDDLSLEALQRRAVNRLIESHGDNVLISEFRKQQLFYAVRDADDKKNRYFENIEEIDTLPAVIYTRLLTAYGEIAVDSFEGKD